MFRLIIALVFGGGLALSPPAFAAPAPEVYGRLPAIGDVHLSPSGARFAFVADDGRGRRVYVVDDHMKPVETIAIGDKKVIGVQWAGESLLLVHLSTTVNVGPDFTVSKMELSSVIVLNLETHKGVGVFAKRNDVNPVVYGEFGVANIKGRWFGFFGGQTLESVIGGNGDMRYSNTTVDGDVMTINTDLYRVDLATGALSLAAKGEFGSAGWLVGPDGEVVARALQNQKTGAWRILAGAFGGRELAVGRSKLSGVEILGLGRNGDSILVSHATGDGNVIEDIPLGGGAARTVRDEAALGSPIEDSATGRWIGQAFDADAPDYTFFSRQADARVRGARKAFPGYRTRLESWSEDFGRMVVFTDGKDDAGTFWLVDIATGSARPIGTAYPVAPVDVGPVSMIDYKAADGLALRGVLTLPPGRAAKNLPLVVMPHGGPWARDYPGFDYWAQAFAARGYAVFQPNFRGSDGYGAKLRDAGMNEWGRQMQTDISDGAAELAHQGIVDPKRACIVGWSYGGYAALAGVTLQHGLYRCAVSTAGVSDLTKMFLYLGDEAGGEDVGTRYWKAFVGDRSHWNEISPAKQAAKAGAPILLIHGKDDTVVPIDQSDAMEHALKAAGKPVERLTLAGADHWLLREDTRVAMLKASVAFVEKYNPPDPPASPAP